MDNEDYVETSDPEELEAVWFAAHSSSRQHSKVPDILHEHSSPRKRRKLSHDGASSRHSTPPVATSAFVEPPILEDNAQVESLIPVSITSVEEEILSEDELDVISQRQRSLSLEQQIQDVPADEMPAADDPLLPSLFTPPQTPEAQERAPSQRSSPHSSPLSSPPRHRFSSLPPSSPSRSPAAARSSQRARSHSPIPSPSRSHQLTTSSPRPEQSHAGPASDDHEIAANLAQGRYSFRSRKPQQQRPYAYDLQLYKGQLQNIPEAIVAAPKHYDRGEGHHHRNGHHSHENETQDDDFIVPDDNLNEESQVPRPSRSAAHQGAPEHPDVILPESMQMSDDDDLPELPWSLDGATRRNKEWRSKANIHRRKRFPMRKRNTPGPDEQVLRAPNDSERPYKRATQNRRYEDRHYSSQQDSAKKLTEDGELPTRAASQATSSTVEVDVPVSADVEEFGPLYSDDLPQALTPSPPSHHRPELVEVSSDEETKHSSNSEPDIRREFESMDSKRQRKKMKAWSRMMPAVMIKKFLGQQPSAKATRKRTVTPSDDNIGSENSDDLAPGKSKRLRKGNDHNIPVEIRGDTESSDSSDTSEANPGESSDASGSDVSGGDDRGQDEAIEAGWLDHDSSRRYGAPLMGRNEDLIDRMLTRTRTTKPRNRGSRAGGAKRPKNPALDIVIAAPSRQKIGRQSRLPFRPDSLSTGGPALSYRDEVYDLTLSEPLSPRGNELAPVLNLQRRKLSKNERKRQLLLKQTYIIPSDGKLIRSGRKRRLHIDLNDGAFHEALAPLQTADAKPRVQVVKKHIKPHTNVKRHRISSRTDSGAPLRQTVLTEFDDGSLVEGFNYQDDRPCAEPPPQTKNNRWRHIAKFTADFRIRALPVGLAFGPNTYIGKQLLHDLIIFILAGDIPPDQPHSFSNLGVTFLPEMVSMQYAQSLEKVADVLCERLSPAQVLTPQVSVDFKEYEVLMHSSCRYLGWLLTQVPQDERKVIFEATSNCARRTADAAQSRLDSSSLDAGQSNFEALSTLWFAIELSSRAHALGVRMDLDIDVADWKERILMLMRFLISFGFEEMLGSITSAQDALDGPSDDVTVAGLWVCLIHFLPKMSEILQAAQGSTSYLSSLLLEIIQENRHLLPSDLDNSEYIWRTIFSLCALSQFSINGNAGSKVALPPCWNLVVAALSTVRLTHEPTVDQTRAQSTLKERDKYVHLIVSRCYLLCARWKWTLGEAHVMIDKLVSVFKSRKFSDLLGEDPDFPAFLRRFNLRLLKEIRRSDSAFCIVLKVIAMAAVEEGESNDGVQRASNKLRRLLSLIIPIGKIPFTKQSPPVNQELSMLYNRFSSIIIAIYLERSVATLKGRVEQARRYVDFPNLDWKSKQACIRAAMHITILVQHLGLPLDEPLKWFEDMTNVLLTEYRDSATQPKASDGKSFPTLWEDQGRIVLCLQLLLGSVRLVIETPSMDLEVPLTPTYPDVGLLSGPWIKNVFSTRTLTSIVTTGLEIQKLVQAFLDARAKVIQPPRLPVVANVESQESQDYFADYEDEFDYNDPDLQAILDSGNTSNPSADNSRQKDAAVAEIMDTDITHAIYRLVIQHFRDPSNSRITENTADDFYHNTDRWVDCWVGCAAVVVQNERRVWSYYLEMGSQSWTSISDSSLRRRVGLRFMHRLLQLDPSAYRSNQDAFLKVLMESLVTFKVTLEGEYALLLFSIDGLRHSILRDLPIERSETTGEFQVSNTRFSELRAEIIASILSNLNDSLTQSSESEVQSHYNIQTWIGFVIHMLSTTRDVHESLTTNDARTLYSKFCRRIFSQFMTYPRLRSQPRFASILTWATSRFGQPIT